MAEQFRRNGYAGAELRIKRWFVTSKHNYQSVTFPSGG
jgi:hypothetical protein